MTCAPSFLDLARSPWVWVDDPLVSESRRHLSAPWAGGLYTKPEDIQGLWSVLSATDYIIQHKTGLSNRTKKLCKSPLTNGICERFHAAILQEF